MSGIAKPINNRKAIGPVTGNSGTPDVLVEQVETVTGTVVVVVTGTVLVVVEVEVEVDVVGMVRVVVSV